MPGSILVEDRRASFIVSWPSMSASPGTALHPRFFGLDRQSRAAVAGSTEDRPGLGSRERLGSELLAERRRSSDHLGEGKDVPWPGPVEARKVRGRRREGTQIALRHLHTGLHRPRP